mgnify:CR=1 FL=1
MDSPADVVRRFYDCMQARDWSGAGACLSSEVHIEYSATGEVFDGERFLQMNRDYEEGWTIHVIDVIAVGDRAASQVRVDVDSAREWCLGFYTVRDGVITDGMEHWVTEGSVQAPEWRAPYRTR